MNYILLFIGFILLIKGADYFVDGSSNIAKILKIPPIIIGLTIVAFGTSAPEAAVSITASIQGQNGMAMGNVVGSNIFNILMVLGATAFISTLHIEKSIVKSELPFLLAITILTTIFSLDLNFSRTDGLILLLLFAIFLYNMIKNTLKSKDLSISINKDSNDINLESQDSSVATISKNNSVVKSILFSIGGMIAIIFGGKIVVSSASSIASSFGISDQLIGLTIVAIGTSLPEFVTSIIAATKGESDIAVGNVVGSNIFNIAFVLASSAIISPLTLDPKLIIDSVFMIFVTILTYFFAIKNKDISRFESIILIGIYICYMIYLIISA